jgi:hypothetical protein
MNIPLMNKTERTLIHKLQACILVCLFLTASTTKLTAIEKPLIFPIPQQMEATGEEFVLDESVSILVPEGGSDRDLFLARFLVREISDKYGVALEIESCREIPSGRKVVVMGSVENPLVDQLMKENGLHMSETDPGPEGYVLQVETDRILVAGWDDPGAFYGLQSLRQLVEAQRGTAVRGVIVELNCMRLDNHPEVNAGWIEFSRDLYYSRSNSTEGLRGEEKNSSHYDAGDGYIIEKDDVRDMVEFANQNFLEVIPEIPSLTHGYYLLTRHPELAEYPGDVYPDTYCPSNPESYELMFDVYDEYIEVIRPKMIHIGHDEWWGAPLDVCPLCRGKDPSELFASDIQKIHDYMAEKGIKIAMWGDYLLESVRNKGPQERTSSTGVSYRTPGAVRPSVVRESIPKDILIFNWFWVDMEKDLELHDFGFRQLYGNFKPNISNWDERIRKIDLAGGAPSSWASTNEFNFGKDLILDFLGCANLLWSTHTIEQIDLPPVVWELMPSVRANLAGRRIPSEDGDRVEPVDISSYLNLPKDSKVFGVDLSTFRPGPVRSLSKVFELADPASSSGRCAIAVGSKGSGGNSLPAEVSGIAIGEDVSSLIFLHASALPSGNQKAYFNIPDFFDTADLLGWYEIVYEDGYRITVPVQYGVNILEWNPGRMKSLDRREGETGSAQNAYCYQADPVWCSGNMKERPIAFFAFEWINPRFGKVIKEVNLHGTVDFQAQDTDYGKPEFKPMPSNAILLAAISKVKKRTPFKPSQ